MKNSVSFKKPEELNDPQKVNKAMNDALLEVDYDVEERINKSAGKFIRTNQVVTRENFPTNVGENQLIFEDNDTNRRILFRTGDKIYFAEFSEL